MEINTLINDATIYWNTTSSKKSTHNDTNFTAKLRRLKINESILIESLNKNAACTQIDGELNPKYYLKFSEFRKFSVTIKKYYNDLNQLFQDIKASTSSKDMIQSLDIDDIKKSTHDLEKNLKLFKSQFLTEFSALRSAEKQINHQLNDIISKNFSEIKPRTRTAKYTEIVTSPVKTVMTSPFKCLEVQEYQEFMTRSKNRLGGWDEYHHNLFVNIWQKHLGTEYLLFSDEIISKIITSAEFKLFLIELIPKLLGMSEEEVITHAKWYINYLHFKYRQQEAIDKWRSTKQNMRKYSDVQYNTPQKSFVKYKSNKMKRQDKYSKEYLKQKGKVKAGDETRLFTRKCLSDEIHSRYVNNNENSSLRKNFDRNFNNYQKDFNFLKSTKQSMIKCSSKDLKYPTIMPCIENIKKLGIPSWRADIC